jgi:hypothetical protein
MGYVKPIQKKLLPFFIVTNLLKKIAKLDLKYLSPVDEGRKKKTAFDQLVLPTGHKDIVHCLVAQHFRDKEARVSDNEEVDIVRGKGKSYFATTFDGLASKKAKEKVNNVY